MKRTTIIIALFASFAAGVFACRYFLPAREKPIYQGTLLVISKGSTQNLLNDVLTDLRTNGFSKDGEAGEAVLELDPKTQIKGQSQVYVRPDWNGFANIFTTQVNNSGFSSVSINLAFPLFRKDDPSWEGVKVFRSLYNVVLKKLANQEAPSDSGTASAEEP